MNTKEEIINTVYEVLEKDFSCPREKLTPETDLFKELDLDSIDAVDLLVRLQKLIKKRVDPEDFKQIRTLGDLITVIEKIVSE